jgi:hypothetical protein
MPDLILPEDLKGAPRDDVGKFIHLERLARQRYHDAVRDADEGEAKEWEFHYTSSVLALAEACNIEELSGWELPRLGAQNWWSYCRDFRSAAEHLSVRLFLQRHQELDLRSVTLDAETKATLQGYINDVRDFINKSDMPVAKREQLLKRLSEFQAELDQERTDPDKIGALICAVASTTEEVIRYVAPKLWDMARALGLARESADARDRTKQLPAKASRKRVEPPPRKPEPKRVFDDEIPF